MEKFALLNLLNALSGLAAKPADGQQSASGNAENGFANADGAAGAATNAGSGQTKGAPVSEPPAAYPNVMASVLERHEAIANRVKNKK